MYNIVLIQCLKITNFNKSMSEKLQYKLNF